VFISKIQAYLKSVASLGRLHAGGLPFIPRKFIRLAPFNREAYNSFLIEALDWRLPASPVIYDVGANKGDFALAFQTAYPQANITLFEPLAAHVARLERLKQTGGFTWTIHSVALGPNDEELAIEVPEGQEAASSLHGFGEDYLKHNPAAGKTTRHTCQVRRLDTMYGAESDAIDLLKIDVEGFEFAMLEGASSTLERVRGVVVEVSRLRHAHERHCPIHRMVQLLGTAGLRLFRMKPTVINKSIDDRPLEYDLYFTRVGADLL
jgi:FkbM family methyltransferase